jgi:hypothetical protein
VLYAIAMADYDQDTDCCEKLLTTREGIQTIALYSSSVGRSFCLPEPFLSIIFYYVNKCLIEQPINKFKVYCYAAEMLVVVYQVC